jgi:hypothetical protein
VAARHPRQRHIRTVAATPHWRNIGCGGNATSESRTAVRHLVRAWGRRGSKGQHVDRADPNLDLDRRRGCSPACGGCMLVMPGGASSLAADSGRLPKEAAGAVT